MSPYPSGAPYDQQAMIRGFLSTARAVVSISAASTLLAGCGFLDSSSMVAPAIMTVSSFPQNILPSDFTCHAGGPVSPPLAWFAGPPGTQSYALVVDDSSAPITPFIYWIVFDISPTTTDIQQGHVPPGARQALNSAGQARYDPPCPEGNPHSYRFTIYALNKVLRLPAGTPLQSAWTAIAAATIGRGRTVPSGNP
jgi:hypothetical protein